MFSFLRKRIPFELAEPGTDPTRQRNSHPRPTWLQKNGLLVVGLLAFAIGGWWFFIREPAPPAKSAPVPTAVPTLAPEMTPSSGFFASGSNSVSGFLPTSEQQPTPTTVVTWPLLNEPPSVTITPAPDYNVFVDDESILCWCNLDDQPAQCYTFIPKICEEQQDEQ